MDQVQRREGETLKDFKLRICKNKDVYNLKWNEVASIINNESGDSFSESKYRKWYTAFNEGFEYALDSNSTADEYMKELTLKKFELEKEKKKVQTEKLELNRWAREDARIDLFEEKLIQAIRECKTLQVPVTTFQHVDNDKVIFVSLADAHYGKEFCLRGLKGEILNQYSPEIFEERMWKLLEKVKLIINKEQTKQVVVGNLSDSIDGILRMSQLMSLRYGVVESIQKFSEFLSVWLNELSRYCKIDYYSVNGNHCDLRLLTGKKGDFPQENAERIINWYLEARLRTNPNITVHRNDKDYQFIDILGYNVLLTHGQDNKKAEDAIKDMQLFYGYNIDYLITGHLHRNSEKTVGVNGSNNIEVIKSASIIGTDDFAASIKKRSNAGSKVIVFEQGVGKSIVYDVSLQ